GESSSRSRGPPKAPKDSIVRRRTRCWTWPSPAAGSSWKSSAALALREIVSAQIFSQPADILEHLLAQDIAHDRRGGEGDQDVIPQRRRFHPRPDPHRRQHAGDDLRDRDEPEIDPGIGAEQKLALRA